MFGVEHRVTITQVSTRQYPGRNKVFKFNFVTQSEGASTWAHLTDTFNVILPRRLYFIDGSGKAISWAGSEKENGKYNPGVAIYGNPDAQPLILRGDKIKVEQGYSYFVPTQSGFDRTQTVVNCPQRFDGFITRIKNKTPMEFECKDNMFILMQTPVENKEWNVDGKTYTLEKMLKEMVGKSTYPGASEIVVRTDNFATYFKKKLHFTNFTVAQVLDELRKDDKLESFFYGNELRCGLIRYYPEDRVNHSFHFQKNIIDDNLDYQRRDDIRIGIIAKSINKVEVSSNNSSGKPRTKHVTLETRVGDQDGEIRTLFFWGVQSTKELQKLAEKKLPFIRYEGFRGSFMTFALPRVKHGDSVTLVDENTPERSGTYLVKRVDDISSSDQGIKQRVHLDIRIDGLNDKELIDFQRNGI